ncbi:MAG: sarcosine oxidase subunit gamma family protein [Azospirillaceae bacterium]
MATEAMTAASRPAWHPLPDGTDHAALAVLPPATLLNLRGRPRDAGFLDAVAAAMGVRPPLEANRRQVGEAGAAAWWLGPDEWLLTAPDGKAAPLERAIRDARGDDPWLAVTDVSHTYTGLALTGPLAREALSAGCALDLHARAFAPDACAQTMLAKARVMLALTDDRPCFEILVRNSFARYLAGWLADALRLVEDAGKPL